MIAAISPGVIPLWDAVTFLVSNAVLAPLRLPPTARRERRRFLTDLTEGRTAIAEHPWLWALTGLNVSASDSVPPSTTGPCLVARQPPEGVPLRDARLLILATRVAALSSVPLLPSGDPVPSYGAHWLTEYGLDRHSRQLGIG
ncbi:hypothetical protein HII36_40080 [Nonomuraea sp. NN258]|uniref:hypothetical protein n=1 Tax=Nonomuraea antri TaxID=2730852 RepID=UPI001568E49E|nr:hypothetical protein [Nonomuraea antri]NRQ37986.1 hypothetical protein [Nonomuraea antri]